MQTYPSLDTYTEATGSHLGYSPWRPVTQEQVNLFADATDDHQWIHTDPERAKDGPFGTPIAHGFLTLALIPAFLREVYRIEGLSMAVNYGSNKVRFPRPVPVGAMVRAGVELLEVEDAPQGIRATTRVTVEAQGSDSPVCVAEILSLLRA
ncbi:MaoC family dehydratase [Sinomonas atrocyanea]|uniref:MaoC family dehydratase n=1 Tax=Sinomonas atrocyanea TaxID=37927 RepID=A0A127A0T2_9MICC|nr:MaoC family dehydratase [Sinomonas atrocyanea]AMM32923.1 MaoC family dehydratase [Sinomonas atrocyanea]GEB65044.1 MaoC family dehydratase [Sinomonas atrocyanea]GGG61246.1 MaoC family dehydratase [Sinomonas atrocyanea]